MQNVRLHHDRDPAARATPAGGRAPSGGGGWGGGWGGGRLNLLLSYAGWRNDSWVEALPRLLEPMGVAALKADCGRTASEVIRAYPIHVAIVDLGLPLDRGSGGAGASEEAGARLLDLLHRLETPPPTVVVKRARSGRDDRREIVAALRAGAFAVVDRPSEPRDLELMLEVLRRLLRRHYGGRWPDGRPPAGPTPTPTPGPTPIPTSPSS